MMNAIHEDYELMEGDEVSIIVSGLGATPLMEQYIPVSYTHLLKK